MPSMVATSSPEPAKASRVSRSPLVSVGRTCSVSTPYTGPESRPSSIRNVEAPVTSSPARIACCTGAAPRQAGSSEKCRLTQPWAGMSKAALGSSAPYATTGQQSGAISRSRARKSSSRGLTGLSTSIPASSARAATDWRRACGRVRRGASGRVTTAATSCRPEAIRASRAGTATSGVPAKTSFIGGAGLSGRKAERGAASRGAPVYGPWHQGAYAHPRAPRTCAYAPGA